MTVLAVGRSDVLRYRSKCQEPHRKPGAGPGFHDVAVLDYGIQDTGADGAAWALCNRGAPGAVLDDFALAWTVRGAPHGYRRTDLAAVALATAPFSEDDAAKRILDGARPLKAAGIPVPPVLRRAAGLEAPMVSRLAGEAEARMEVIRNCIRFHGPARPEPATRRPSSTLRWATSRRTGRRTSSR